MLEQSLRLPPANVQKLLFLILHGLQQRVRVYRYIHDLLPQLRLLLYVGSSAALQLDRFVQQIQPLPGDAFQALPTLLLFGIVGNEAFDLLQLGGNFGGRRLILVKEGINAGVDIPGPCPSRSRTDAIEIGQGGLNVAGMAHPTLRGAQTNDRRIRRQPA